MKPPTDEELAALESTAAPDRKRIVEARETVDDIWRAFEASQANTRRLSEVVRALRRALEQEKERSVAEPKPRESESRPTPRLEDIPAALVAPFRPSSASLESAKSDPLIALAVQVAKAMAPDASELDRSRLIAMAFAASRGDLETFWLARSQRTTKPKAAGGKPQKAKA